VIKLDNVRSCKFRLLNKVFLWYWALNVYISKRCNFLILNTFFRRNSSFFSLIYFAYPSFKCLKIFLRFKKIYEWVYRLRISSIFNVVISVESFLLMRKLNPFPSSFLLEIKFLKNVYLILGWQGVWYIDSVSIRIDEL